MYKYLFIGYFLLMLASASTGQNPDIGVLRNEFDKAYGLDVLLNNGRRYFPETRTVVGNPFWKSTDFLEGNVAIAGKYFKNQQLKFDIEKQNFILFYSNYNGQSGQIILNSLEIDSVTTSGVVFISNRFPEIKQRFIQQIFVGKLSCYIGWHKEFKFNITGVNTGYEYTKELKNYYLIRNGKVYPFTSKGSFLDIFDAKDKLAIRKFVSSQKVRFKKMTETDLKNLIVYCDHLVN